MSIYYSYGGLTLKQNPPNLVNFGPFQQFYVTSLKWGCVKHYCFDISHKHSGIYFFPWKYNFKGKNVKYLSKYKSFCISLYFGKIGDSGANNQLFLSIFYISNMHPNTNFPLRSRINSNIYAQYMVLPIPQTLRNTLLTVTFYHFYTLLYFRGSSQYCFYGHLRHSIQ